MEIGTRIKELRVERHLSQEALAERLNISRQAVTKWENNISMPSTANLLELAKVFHISTEELLLLTAQEKKKKMPVYQWVKYIMLAITIIFIIISFMAFFKLKQVSWLPDNVIGYSEGPTDILVKGSPNFFSVLCGFTGILIVTTILIFIKAKRAKRKDEKD